jgi:hypothetical protein
VGGYIRMDKDLEDDPRIDELAERLADLVAIPKPLACDAVIGGLYRLWRYGDTHLGRHNRLKGVSRGLARIGEVTALPLSLLQVFPREWLQVHPDGSIELPDYSAKNALINRDVRRANGRERTRRWREKRSSPSVNGDASHDVTPTASPRHQSVTTGTGTGTGTGTETTETGSGTAPVSAEAAGAEGAASPRSAAEILEAMQREQRARFGTKVPLKIAGEGGS